MLIIHHSGRPLNIAGWPEVGTIDGLIHAMSEWDLDAGMSYSDDQSFDPHPDNAPFRGPAARVAFTYFSPLLGRTRYLRGDPIYPEHPEAVAYFGNFTTHSFAFRITTDDREVMARLDAAIKANLERQGDRLDQGRPRVNVDPAALHAEALKFWFMDTRDPAALEPMAARLMQECPSLFSTHQEARKFLMPNADQAVEGEGDAPQESTRERVRA